MIEWYKMAFEKYADFKTRSTRNEFWWFFLCNFLVSMLLSMLMTFGASMGTAIGYIFTGIYFLYAIIAFIPNLAVSVRRLHDTGRSGWYLLLSFIPLLGVIILIVFWAQESKQENNKWGPVPGTSGGLEDALVDFDKDIV